jgi:predicted transcriptional regulator
VTSTNNAPSYDPENNGAQNKEAQNIVESLQNEIIVTEFAVRDILSRELGRDILEALREESTKEFGELKSATGLSEVELMNRVDLLKKLKLIEKSEKSCSITEKGRETLNTMKH